MIINVRNVQTVLKFIVSLNKHLIQPIFSYSTVTLFARFLG